LRPQHHGHALPGVLIPGPRRPRRANRATRWPADVAPGYLPGMNDTTAASPAPSPFRRATTLDALNASSRGTAMEPLGIVFTEIGHDYLRATMPVDARTHQPYGLLHGGAS